MEKECSHRWLKNGMAKTGKQRLRCSICGISATVDRSPERPRIYSKAEVQQNYRARQRQKEQENPELRTQRLEREKARRLQKKLEE